MVAVRTCFRTLAGSSGIVCSSDGPYFIVGTLVGTACHFFIGIDVTCKENHARAARLPSSEREPAALVAPPVVDPSVVLRQLAADSAARAGSAAASVGSADFRPFAPFGVAGARSAIPAQAGPEIALYPVMTRARAVNER